MFCAETVISMDTNAVPKLAAGCRLHPTETVLLIPEGTLKLSGPARDILAQLDGRRSVADVVDLLHAQYADAERGVIEQDVLSLLDRMVQRGVLRL
jgi:pyrroloquinoline quinone biosynthesis protein D